MDEETIYFCYELDSFVQAHYFVHVIGIPVATAGLGYPDTKAHAPNENFRLDL